jgi:hypothetical protein
VAALRRRQEGRRLDSKVAITPSLRALPDLAGVRVLVFPKRRSHVCAELQVIAMLIGLFWEVEHGVLYKPAPAVLIDERRRRMEQRNLNVIEALHAFEEQFEEIVHAPTVQ